MLFKWIFDYHKCTFSHIECHLRNIKKEKGFLYNLLENIINLNKSKYRYWVYPVTMLILFVNINKKYNLSSTK